MQRRERCSLSCPDRAWIQACLLALLALLALPKAWALDPDKPFEQYVVNRWTIQDGLPQISVNAIAQDRDGYLWVGTQGGLARFDGVRFTTFTPESTPELPGIWVRSLLVDRAGRLWIGTYKGLTQFDDGRFTRFLLPGMDERQGLDVYALAQDAQGQVWCATSAGLLQVVGGKLAKLANSPAPALSVLPRTDGQWIGGKGVVVHRAGGTATALALPTEASSATVTALVDAQGHLWAGTSQGLYELIDGAWVRLDDPAIGNAPVFALREDHDGNLWVGANHALIRIRAGRVVERFAGTAPLDFRNVTSLFEDREGDLWLGNQVEGLIRAWNGWTRRYSAAQGLNDTVVWSLAANPDGSFWVGTSDGVSLLDHGHFQQTIDGSRLPHPHAYNLLAEHGTLWVGTRQGLVVRHPDGSIEGGGVFAPMATAQINGIVRGPDGRLWFPTTDGLFRLDHEGQPDARLRRFGPSDGLEDVRVRSICWLRDGRLLIGTQSGLYTLRDERITAAGAGTGLPRELDITAIIQLPGGEIVLGSMSEQAYVSAGTGWKVLGPAQGLPHNAIFYMAQDDRGYLWMAGIRGVARAPVADLGAYASGRLDKIRGEMILNERGDRNAGQQAFCCNGAGLSKGYLQDGHVLWLPSRDGVVALDTHGIVKNPVPPHVVIERVDHAGGTYAPATMPALLPASERDLSFEFAAPSFQDPHSVQVRYRLRGYDKGWRELDDPRLRRVNYTNLPPRDYTFEVMAANNAGVWNPAPARLNFAIRPFFHETHLFAALIAVLIATIVYAGYRQQRHVHETQRVALERMVAERTQQLHVSNARLENASQIDPATGLRNRRYLANQLPADLAFYDRQQQHDGQLGQNLLFALVRLRRAEPVAAGTQAPIGDRAVQQFAQVLGGMVRAGDYLVRWDDHDLLLLLRPLQGRALEVVGERIIAAAHGHAFDVGGGAHLALACAVGLAEYPLSRDTLRRLGWEQVIGLARAAMLWAERSDADAWVAFRPTLRSDLGNIVQELEGGPQPLIDSGRLQVLGSATPPLVTNPTSGGKLPS